MYLLGRKQAVILLCPVLLILLVFFIYPLFVVFQSSITANGEFSGAAYKGLFATPLFSQVLKTTLLISFIATLISTSVGYCISAHIAGQSKGKRPFYLTLVMLPLWTSVLVKSFALTVALGDSGVVNRFLMDIFGEGAAVQLLFNRTGVILGMVNYLLPFAVFPILASLLTIDPALPRVAELMGASPLRIFTKITLPLTVPGVIAAALMNLTLSMGMFVTPALLGGRKDLMMANLVELYTRQILDWEGASAIAMILLAISGVLILLLLKMQGGGSIKAVEKAA